MNFGSVEENNQSKIIDKAKSNEVCSTVDDAECPEECIMHPNSCCFIAGIARPFKVGGVSHRVSIGKFTTVEF